MNSTADEKVNESADDRPAVLVVTMGTDYVAPARMPRELSRAGFAVTLIAPKGALATHTGFVDKVGYFPENPTVYEWMQVLAGAMRRIDPRLVLPGDDVTLRMLMWLVLDPPKQLRTELLAELTELVVRSLGDPVHYAASVDKAALTRLAAVTGVPVPPGDAVDDERAAVDLAESLGYPVIVRPTVGTASSGVKRCRNAAEVRQGMRELPQPVGWIPPGTKRALVQRMLTGRHANHPAVAWKGRELAGFTRVAVMQFPDGGPSSVARYTPSPDIAATNARLIGAMGLTGFASTEYLIDDDTGIAYLIEINRRMTPATHTGPRAGVDLASALAAACANREWDGPADAPEGTDLTLALFPQEWLRNHASPFLTTYPNDAPWDDPALLRAMLDLGS
jgi:hypothetical protein